jgi:hypothetical protein
MEQSTAGTAESRYRQLENRRQPFLRRARECAKLTIPSLLPEEGHNGATNLVVPWQSVGARGTRNLSSKLVLTIMPPNSPAFRAEPSFMDLEELKKQGGEGAKMATAYQVALGKYERAVQSEVEQSGDRTVVFEIFDHLVVTGNALMADTKDGLKMYRLDQYVCRRDPSGNQMEIVCKESIDPTLLPDGIQEMIRNNTDSAEKSVDLYTHQYRDGNQWRVYQEAAGIRLPDSEGTYPLNAPAFVALRFQSISNEDYGRGYVEEYLGDLKSLDGLRQAIVEGAAAAAKLLILVNPNGTTRMKTIAEAPNGAVRQGRADDVTTVQMQKFHDFGTAERVSQEIKQDLMMAFLMNTAIQRDAERVTAEEIRYMAAELESALGSLYSTISREFQTPYINRKINKMERAGRLPVLPKKDIKITIITGFEALGRGQDLNKLDLFVKGLAADVGPEMVARFINMREYMNRRALALGIDTEGLIRTEEEMAAEEQQAQQMGMINQFGPEIIKQAGAMQKGAMPTNGTGTNQG